MKWYFIALQKYAIFNGRSRRAEYWMFIVYNTLITCVLTVVEAMSELFGLVLIYGLAVMIPGVSVAVRRLHDTDRSAWWLLIVFVPIVGWIVLLFFMVLEGKPERNRFGPDPKRVGVEI